MTRVYTIQFKVHNSGTNRQTDMTKILPFRIANGNLVIRFPRIVSIFGGNQSFPSCLHENATFQGLLP